MEYKLNTSTKNNIIIQELFKKEENITKRLFTWIINTREKDIRNALIDLGWTPPPE